MDRDKVAKTWVFRGLSNLFFAFDSDDDAFEDNARFSEIMGLEKFLKAVLLYQRHVEYESLGRDEARQKLNKMAMELGHKFNVMLNALADGGLRDIEQIKRSNFDGYEGVQLIQVVEKGYMETRYPVPESVSHKFPIKNTRLTHDPLSSSGITKFTYAFCNACYYELSKKVDFDDMLTQVQEKFQHRGSFSRFNNCFWESRCKR